MRTSYCFILLSRCVHVRCCFLRHRLRRRRRGRPSCLFFHSFNLMLAFNWNPFPHKYKKFTASFRMSNNEWITQSAKSHRYPSYFRFRPSKIITHKRIALRIHYSKNGNSNVLCENILIRLKNERGKKNIIFFFDTLWTLRLLYQYFVIEKMEMKGSTLTHNHILCHLM